MNPDCYTAASVNLMGATLVIICYRTAGSCSVSLIFSLLSVMQRNHKPVQLLAYMEVCGACF